MDIAYEIAKETQSEIKWKQLGDLALSSCQVKFNKFKNLLFFQKNS